MVGEMNTHVFRGKGYRLWAVMAEGRLRERHMFQYIEGKMSQPLSDREWKEYAAKIGEDVASARETHEIGKKIAFATLASLIDWPILCKFPRAVDPAKLWEALRERYANDDLQSRATLYRNLCTATSTSFRSLDEYVSAVEEHVSQLEAIGETVEDEMACVHLLKGLDPKRYRAFLDGIGARESSEMSFSWLANRVRSLDPPPERPERPERSYHAAAANGQGTRKCKFCKKDWHRRCPEVTCHKCQGKGHFARDCQGRREPRQTPQTDQAHWILDSGATSSMTSDETELWDVRSIPERRITVANGEEILCFKKGTLKLRSPEGTEISLEGVLIVPGLKEKLISIRNLQNRGYEITFGPNGCTVTKNGKVALKAQNGTNGLYEVECLMARTDMPAQKLDTIDGWHQRLGHLHHERVRKLIKEGLIVGAGIQGQESGTCQACAEGKQASSRHEKIADRTPERPGEIISADVVGPIRPLGAKGEKYISVMIDHYTGWISVKATTARSTDEMLRHAQEMTAFMETQTRHKARMIRTDSAPEYLTDSFEEWIAREGMVHETTAPYSPASNGKVERLNRTLSESIRSQMRNCAMGPEIWPHAATNAAYLINRTSISPHTGRTPYESIFGIAPNVRDIVPFGRRVFVKLEVPQAKLAARSTPGTTLGRREGQEGQLVLLDGGGTIVSRNIIEAEDSNSRAASNQESDLELGDEEDDDEDPSEEFAGYTHAEEREDNPSVDEAMESEHREEWLEAIEAEFRNIKNYEVLERVPRTAGGKTLKTKIVLKRKRGPTGEILKYKARLVALGCGQRPGIDFRDTFAPVCREESVKILIHLAATRGYFLHQLDIDAAYLNAELKEEIIVELPKQFHDKMCAPHEALRLKRALYGLKQAGHEWHRKLKGTLNEQGWTAGKVDPCIFARERQGTYEYLALYVDDILMAAPTEERMKVVKQELGSTFTLKDMGPTRNLLGMKIDRRDGIYHVAQPMVAQKLISEDPRKTFRSTPMSKTEQEGEEQTVATEEEAHTFRSQIGTLLYLSRKSRPDIAYAVGALARLASAPTQRDLEKMRWLVDYIRYTPDYRLVIRGGGMEIRGWSDASFAEWNDRKSTSGYVIQIGQDTAVWGSRRQSIVATSTLEAEYIALSECARAVIWVKMLVQHDLGEKIATPIKIFCDNMGAIEVARNPTHHFKSKHIDVKYHFVRDLVESKEIELAYISSAANVADIMTKALNKSAHHNHREKMGVIKASGGV